MGTMVTTYRDAGVDVDKSDKFVEWLESKVRKTYNERVISGVGGFASLYDMGNGKYLASGADGVGTKLILAKRLGIHRTIGVDLVAMCANDVICTGAKPLFFLDYMASSTLDLDVSKDVMQGITDGCMEAGAALIGGETAEMPGMYAPGDYDLAGFCVGEVEKEDLLGGSRVNPGDTLIGLASSGFHSNGFSLLRRLLDQSDFEREGVAAQLLTPTKIYVDLILSILESNRDLIHGLAHITGSGFENIPRMNESLYYRIDKLPPRDEIPDFMSEFFDRSGLSSHELCRTFNMGVGMVIATPDPDSLVDILSGAGEKFWILGAVESLGDREDVLGLPGLTN